ncbi:MAG: tetratricopeptide repeat protein [Isosphaeraceae bacterium]
MLRSFDPNRLPPATVNSLAWSCALGPDALDDYDPLIRLATRAAASRPEPNRLNTVGAILFRAGRFEEAIRQLDRAIQVHGAGGTQYDALFLAMTHHRLGHSDEARRWYDRATSTPPAAMQKPGATGDTSWIPRVELETLQREAAAALGLGDTRAALP